LLERAKEEILYPSISTAGKCPINQSFYRGRLQEEHLITGIEELNNWPTE